jgi:hypothetical protein
LATPAVRQKTCHSFPRLAAACACDFYSAVFFLSNRRPMFFTSNSNIKIPPAPLKIVHHLFIEWGIAWLVRIKLLDKRRQ